MIDIKDNFLPIREFEQMHSELMAWNFPWYTSKVVNDSDQNACLLYTSPSPRDLSTSRMPSSA